jgi:hypothetical protein
MTKKRTIGAERNGIQKFDFVIPWQEVIMHGIRFQMPPEKLLGLFHDYKKMKSNSRGYH